MKIAVIGEKKSVLAFRALGVETFGVNCQDDLREALQAIEQNDFAIIFITEDIAKDYEKELEQLHKKTLPAVLVVPGVKGPLGLGKEGLKKILERALGSALEL